MAVTAWLLHSRWEALLDALSGSDARDSRVHGESPRARSAQRGESGPPPGTAIRIQLSIRPAPIYNPRLRIDDADETYGRIVTKLGSGRAVYDPILSRAAREVAYQSAVIGDAPPEEVLTFLLHSAGAPDSHAALFRLSTTSEDAAVLDDAIRSALGDAPDGDGPLYVGVGEAETPDERYTRRVVVLLSRRDFGLDPAPRSAPLGATWTARGQLPPGFSGPSATILFPDGRLESAAVEAARGRFTVSIPVGKAIGTMLVSIDGVGAAGPTKLMQLEVEVGRDVPRELSAVMPEVEPKLADIAAAERRAFDLLQRDRAGARLPPFQLDPRLSAIARAHSEEMRDRRYFGHASPVTGLASDRLTRAGYRSVAHAENLAKNDSLGEAQASLMTSVSHRANIVRPGFTHVGIGIARATEADRDAWYVTQLFATPVALLDAAAAPAQVLSRLDVVRRKAGARSLRIDDRLNEVAARAAERAAAGETDGLPEEAARQAQRAVHGSVGVSVHVVYGMDQFEPPDVALQPGMTTAGVGVVQSADDIHGRTGVVVIVAR